MLMLIQALVVFILAISIHELTHYLYAKWTGDFIKVDFDEWSPTVHFDDKMTYRHQLYMYSLAILAGAFIIIPFILFSTNGILYLAILLIYLWGCQYDIDQILKLNNDRSWNSSDNTRIAH